MSDMRLIDANHVSRVLRGVEGLLLSHGNDIAEGAVRAVREHIENWKTVDAVPVVRCSACKEADRSVFLPEGCLFCNVWDSVTRCDGFCYCGGVRDDDHG